MPFFNVMYERVKTLKILQILNILVNIRVLWKLFLPVNQWFWQFQQTLFFHCTLSASFFLSAFNLKQNAYVPLRADYSQIFNPGWNFNSLNRVEISSRINSKLFFKMALQLHVKISTWYTKLKFQLDLTNPRWNFNPGWKFQIFCIIDIFSNTGWKFDTTYSWIPCLSFSK